MTRAGSPLAVAGLLSGLAVAAILMALPMDAWAQGVAAVAMVGVLMVASGGSDSERHHLARLALIVIGLLITGRYLVWRGLYTLHASDLVSLFCVYGLFLTEVYSGAIHALGCFVNVRPRRRPDLTIDDLPAGAVLPSVDVLVPSYNEDAELLEMTLRAAKQMHYAGRVTVCLLDDGGTDQKCADPDPLRAAAAIARRRELQALCRRLGVRYITRPRNVSAKAGNLNHALGLTDGDLIAVLDADHIPTVDFLHRTVPWMVRHDDVFLVQTPHFMINPDPIDRNLLQSFSRMPSENDMFYMTIQRGLDFWDSSFFCGSAAVLRRRHLDEVGGLSGDSITEDAEAALEMHSLGYRSVYLDRPLVSGLAPDTFTGFVVQRMRWAQGMIQILLLKRPYLRAGLSWHQRVGYMSSLLFWLFPFARVVFLTAPLAYLLFGLEVYNASVAEIFAYTLPHVIATYVVSTSLFGRTRWPLVSEIYEVMQCLFSLRAVTRVFLNPRAPSFVVTPKGETLEDNFVSPLARPFYILFALAMLGFAVGAWRFNAFPLSRELTAVVLAWNVFNFVILIAALGALMERRQRRSAPRIPVRESVLLRLGDGAGGDVRADVADLSAGGLRLRLPADVPPPPKGARLDLVADAHALGRQVVLPVEVRMVAGRAVGCAFDFADEERRNQVVAWVFGDSNRWRYFQERRLRKMPAAAALALFFNLLWRPLRDHAAFAARMAMQPLRRRAKSTTL